jgi:alpha-N-arabinofuranosidase
MFGSFVEHLGRAVYSGIYEPGHPTADEDGFRGDVLELTRELGVTVVRYPGGNFVSSYRWEDGIGPREQRPKRVDLAWHTIETNEVGIDEFARWSEKAGTELMLAVNLGTRGIEHAVDLLEYTNLAGGTEWSDRRIANGAADPYGVRMWCLGNEMDGPWQVGYCTPDEYGALASQVARAMRRFDETLELVLCGSSKQSMPTFGIWERQALERAYDEVDFISCHAYYEELDGDLQGFLACAVEMDSFIETVIGIADEVKDARGSDKVMQISVDEWNVWYNRRYHAEDKITDPNHWPVAPRLLEDTYTVADAVVVGSLLISFLRHADRVTAACQAQLVNVIAPIMTEPGGAAWRQTTFYPFADASRSIGRMAVPVVVDSPIITTERYGDAPMVDAIATVDPADGATTVYLVNRSATESIDVVLPTQGEATTWSVLTDDDPYATNTHTDPERVVPRLAQAEAVPGGVRLRLPPVSWSVVDIATGAGGADRYELED